MAQNRSKKTADKIISNDTNAGNAVSVLAAKSVLTLKSCGHFIVAANKACKSSPNVFPATVKPLLDISNKPNLESLNNGIFHQSISSWILPTLDVNLVRWCCMTASADKPYRSARLNQKAMRCIDKPYESYKKKEYSQGNQKELQIHRK